MLLTDARNRLLVDLADTDKALLTPDILDRAIHRAVSDISRFLPRDQILETTLVFTVTDEGWTSAAVAGTYVALAYSPIKSGSEVVKNESAVTCVRDTDYYMDYTNGKITNIGGSLISCNRSCTISYVKSKIAIDLSSILDDLIRVDRVEYPVGNVPQDFVSCEVILPYLYVKGAYDNQAEMTESEHLAVHYKAKHTPPTPSAAGTYPMFLDDTVILAASAYALFTLAMKYNVQVVTDFASSRTALSRTSATRIEMAAALDKVATYIADMDTALDKVPTHTDSMVIALLAAAAQAALAATALGKINSDSGKTYLTDADTALDAFLSAMANPATALGNVNTYLAGDTESAKALLAQIATDAADLRTAFVTAVNAANSALDSIDYSAIATETGKVGDALDKVATYLENNSNADSKSLLEKIATEVTALRDAVNTALDLTHTLVGDIATDELEQATTGAWALLATGDDLIDEINKGTRVPELYREYAETKIAAANVRVSGAMASAQEALQRMSNLRSYIDQSDGWGRVALGFVNEATQRASVAAHTISMERAKVEQANGFVAEASSRLDGLRSLIEQAAAYTGISDGFIAEAREGTALALAYVSESAQRAAIADRYIAEASERNNSASAYIAEASGSYNIVSAYIAEANSRYNMANAFIAEANSRAAEIDRDLAESDKYVNIATQNLTLANRFKEEAIERRNEVWAIWRSAPDFLPDISRSAARQLQS